MLWGSLGAPWKGNILQEMCYFNQRPGSVPEFK